MTKITFKSFLNLVESRTTQYDDAESAIAWIEHYAPQFIKGKTPIFRGASANNSKEIRFGDSTAGRPRKSANTVNFYTLWMDNHESFSDAPRRAHSFICSSNEGYANGFGNPYLVIPADKNKVGVVPHNDLWGVRVMGDDLQLNHFVDLIADLLGELKLPSDTWAELEDSLKSVKFDELKDAKIDFSYQTLKAIINYADKNNLSTLYDLFEHEIKPSSFEFMRAGDLSKSIGDRNEVWIEGPCLFLPLAGLSNKPEQDAFLEWAEEKSPMIFKALTESAISSWEDSDDSRDNESENPDDYSDEDTLTHSKRQK